jgi:hypothetical protein
MAAEPTIEDLIQTVAALDRDTCKARLRLIERPRLDFPDDFLDALSLERLRHLLLAAYLQARRRPNQRHAS